MLENFKPDPDDVTKIVYNDERIQRVVVCAANRYGELIICGARHHDPIMNNVLDALKTSGIEMSKDQDQGFIDQWGNYITREDAKTIALSSGQLLRDPDIHDQCFSENLY